MDCSYLNKFIAKEHFKFKLEDWSLAEQKLTEGCFGWCFDITKGYYHVDIHEEYKTFLGFAWNFGGQTAFSAFQYCVLGFQ